MMYRAMVLIVFATSSVAADPPSNIRKLTLTPRAVPSPVLRYDLMPRLRDSRPGNRALEYARAFDLRPVQPDQNKKEEKAQVWREGSVEALPKKEVEEYLKSYTSTLRAYMNAARLSEYQSEWLPRLKAEGINLLLPGVQHHRQVAAVLSLKHRLELAEHRYADAHRTLQSLFRAGKDVGEDPTLIQMLVGLAITNIALAEVEQWIQQPDSPNLYWALTSLPRPFIDPRPGLEGEATFFDTMLPNLKEFEKGPLSVERSNALLADLLTTMGNFQGELNPSEKLSAIERIAHATLQQFHVASHYESAKKSLIESGFQAADLEAMAPSQVVILRSVRRVRSLYDDQMKCFLLPIPQGRAEFLKLGDSVKKGREEFKQDTLFVLATMVVPAMDKVHNSLARTERKLASLRVVEAIRLHAAANGGQLPKALSEITAVFVPEDPVTGKPFEYSVNGKSFTLIGPAPAGIKPDVGNSLQYEATLR